MFILYKIVKAIKLKMYVTFLKKKGMETKQPVNCAQEE
jgi:hypothetical protein